MFREDYCEMKIKEKGLTGKAAVNRKEMINRKGFNAFREMARAKTSSSKPTPNAGEKGDGGGEDGGSEKKPDVFLEFMGTMVLIRKDQSGNGYVKDEDVPFVPGATLKFEGCGGDVSWPEIKVCVCVHS